MKRTFFSIQTWSVRILLALLFVYFVYINLPVTAFMKVTVVTVEKGRVVLHVTGRKLRDCDLVPHSKVGWYMLAGIPIETEFEFLKDTTPESTRPAAWMEVQDFGHWEWKGVPLTSTEVRLTARHKCSTGIKTRIIGTWPFLTEG